MLLILKLTRLDLVRFEENNCTIQYYAGTPYTQAIASTWRETGHFLMISHRYFWWTVRTLNNVGNGHIYIPGLLLHSWTAWGEHRSDGRNWSLPLSRLRISRRSQDQVSSLLPFCSPLSIWHWLPPFLFLRSDSLATGCVTFYIPFYLHCHPIVLLVSNMIIKRLVICPTRLSSIFQHPKNKEIYHSDVPAKDATALGLTRWRSQNSSRCRTPFPKPAFRRSPTRSLCPAA